MRCATDQLDRLVCLLGVGVGAGRPAQLSIVGAQESPGNSSDAAVETRHTTTGDQLESGDRHDTHPRKMAGLIPT